MLCSLHLVDRERFVLTRTNCVLIRRCWNAAPPKLSAVTKVSVCLSEKLSVTSIEQLDRVDVKLQTS